MNTYHNELKGSPREESFLQVLGILRKLRNYGRGFVSFGEPLTLNGYLNEQVPGGRPTSAGRSAPSGWRPPSTSWPS